MDPFNLKASLRALAASKRQEPSSMPEPQEEADPIRKLGKRLQSDIVEEAPPGLLERAGGTAMSGLATVGNFLDLPGSMVRDTLSWLPGGPKPQNPFDQLASPFTHHNRLTGRELMRGYGLVGKEDTMLNFLGGLGAEIALDPLSYLTFGAGAMTRGGKAARALNLERHAKDVASKALGRPVGKREARHVVTPRMLVEHLSEANRPVAEGYLDRFKDMGVEGERLDRPLGGMARISIPFTDRPFTFNKKPVTFWGLTDEEGIIGGGRVRGRGQDPLVEMSDDLPPNPPAEPVRPTPDPSMGPDDLGGPRPNDPAPEPEIPPQGDLPPQTPIDPNVPPTPVDPIPSTPVDPGSITPNVRITPKNDMEFDVDVDIPEAGSAKASVAYASDGAEQPRILISNFQREAKAGKGTGRAMINKIIEAAKDKNPVSVSGKFDTPQALGAFGSVFGRENIIFHDRAGKPVDVTFADAMKAPQNYIATHEFKKPVVETIQEAAPATIKIEPFKNLGELTDYALEQVKDLPKSELIDVAENIYRRHGSKFKDHLFYSDLIKKWKQHNESRVAAESAPAVDDVVPPISAKKGSPELRTLMQQAGEIAQRDGQLNIDSIAKELNVDDQTRLYMQQEFESNPLYGTMARSLDPNYVPISRVADDTGTPPPAMPDLGVDLGLSQPPPATIQPTLAGFEPPVVKAAKRGRKKAQEVPPTQQAPAKTFTTERGSQYEIMPDGTTVRNKAARPEHPGDSGIKQKSDVTIYVDDSGRGLSAAGSNAVDPRIVFNPDNTVSLIWKNKDGAYGTSETVRNVRYSTEPAVGMHPLELWGKDSVEGLEAFKSMHLGNKIVSMGDAGVVAKQAPVEEVIPTANKVDSGRVKIVDEFTRRLSRIEVDGRPKYGPKEIEVARALAMGNVDGAISQVRSFNKLGAPVDIDFMKLSGQLVKNKLLDEKQLADFNVKMKDVVAEKVLRDYDVMANTPAQLGQLATLEKWSTLDDSSKQFYSGSKQFGDVVASRAQVLRKQTQEEIERLAKIEEAKQAKKGKGKLKSEGTPATGPATAPRMVDLKTLEGLPEQAKPIVGDMISKIGQKLFDDVQLQVGGTGSKATTAGDIDMSTGFIKVYDSAIKNGTVDKTTIHEFWHHLSKYISPDEVRAVRNEFEQAVAAFKKAEGNKPLPYELSSVDEFFAHKLTDLSMKYLGREKPVDLIGKVWAKALDAFEYIWDAIRQTLGYDQTKRIMNSFLDGHRAEVSKYTDATMTQRLIDDLESRDTLRSQSDPILSTPEIAGQLADFRSAKIGKGLDQIGDRIMDTAPARQLTALFDQSVLGQLTKAGQEAARMAFTAYRDAVTREREFMSMHLRTWYDTPNIREDVIIKEELPPLAEYVARNNGDKKLAAKQQLIDARRIQNERVNDIRRLMETSLFDEQGNLIDGALNVTPEMLPSWVGREKINGRIVENPARRVEFAKMLTSWRTKVMNMIRDEHNAGINTSRVDGYFPRIVPDLPGSNSSLWNPNYGKLLDPTHPNMKRRKDFMVGYADGTSVVNDISVDPEFSGIHAKKNIRQKLPDHEVIIHSEKLWNKYKDRLFPQYSHLSYSELGAVKNGELTKKLDNLTREMMELDPRHVENQIPMFSNDLFSAFELRLEHHHRSIMQARAIRTLLEKNALSRTAVGDKEGVTLEGVLKGSKYDNPKAVALVVKNIPGETALQADKAFWMREIQPRIDNMVERYQQRLRGERIGPLVDPLERRFQYNPETSTLTIPNFFGSKSGKDQLDLNIRIDLDEPGASQAGWTRIIDDGGDVPVIADAVLPNPTRIEPGQAENYKSANPPEAILNEIVIPADVADAITKFVKGPRVLEEMRPMVRGYDKATNMWKMMQTGMLPFISFHGRNLGSGQASNFYLGIQNDPRFSEFSLTKPDTWLNPIKRFTVPIADAHRLATGQGLKDLSQVPIFKQRNLNDEQATEALRRAAYTQGITGEKQGLSAEQLMDTVGTAASQFPGLDPARGVNPLAWKWSEPVPESTFAQRWLMPWMSKGVISDKDVFRPGQLGRDLGGYTESLNRLAPFIAMIRQGFDPKAAADAVNRAQVDYTNLSNFNREYTRRLFPFASYTMGMAPTVFRELAERPGGGMARTVMATTQAGQTAEQGVTPDYIRETASIPLGVSEDGTRSYITGFGLPFEDPLQFAQAARGNVGGLLRELGSRMNPLPKALIEMMTGRSLYQAGPFGGREIEDLDPTIGRIAANVNDLITGEKTERAQPFISPWAEYAISNAGPGRMLNTVRTLTDPRKWDVVPWKLALNLGTGVRVADVSPSAQDAILRERLARIMKDFGGRMYSRPYFPDYASENWTPQEAEDAAKIDALMKLLNQRARDRKVVAQ